MSPTARLESRAVATEASPLGHEALIVEGMHCASCAAMIEPFINMCH